jgi:hypothetical protein
MSNYFGLNWTTVEARGGFEAGLKAADLPEQPAISIVSKPVNEG